MLQFTITSHLGPRTRLLLPCPKQIGEYLARKKHAPSSPKYILMSWNFLNAMIPQELMLPICSATEKEPPPKGVETASQVQDGLLYVKCRLYVPPATQLEVLRLCHYSLLAGHLGHFKTLHLSTHSFCWPSMCTKPTHMLIPVRHAPTSRSQTRNSSAP